MESVVIDVNRRGFKIIGFLHFVKISQLEPSMVFWVSPPVESNSIADGSQTGVTMKSYG